MLPIRLSDVSADTRHLVPCFNEDGSQITADVAGSTDDRYMHFCPHLLNPICSASAYELRPILMARSWLDTVEYASIYFSNNATMIAY